MKGSVSRGDTHYRQLAMARNRLDFVRPDNGAGQISAVSVVEGKMHTRRRGRP